MANVVDRYCLKPVALRVLCALEDNADRRRYVRMSANAISDLTRADVKNVRSAINELQRRGFVRLAEKGHGRGNMNVYEVLTLRDEKGGHAAPLLAPRRRRPQSTNEPTEELWVLGRHRLMCGDSTNPAHVRSLIGAAKVDLCLTDPPYSVDYVRSYAQRGGDVASRSRLAKEGVHKPYEEASDPRQLLEFIRWIPADRLVMTYALAKHLFVLADALREYGWELRNELVWVKNRATFNQGAAYQQKHEPILVCARKGAPLNANTLTTATTVFEHSVSSRNRLHPTQRPMDLWTRLILDFMSFSGYRKSTFARLKKRACGRGRDARRAERRLRTMRAEAQDFVRGTIYDPFAGSGTTLIAASQLRVRCLAMEISHDYCQTIIKRWEGLTGQRARRVKPYVRRTREDWERWLRRVESGNEEGDHDGHERLA